MLRRVLVCWCGYAVLVASVIFDTAHAAGLPNSIAVGQPAPDFALKSDAGVNQRLKDLRGQVVVLQFWSRKCGAPCRQECAVLNKLYSAHANEGLVIWGIGLEEPAGGRRALIQEFGLTYPVLWDPETRVATRYGVNFLPLTIMVDKDGKVRYVYASGYRDNDASEMETRVRGLLGEYQ